MPLIDDGAARHNPAWRCGAPDCRADLVPTASGWVCPNGHGGIVSDHLLAERLQAAGHAGGKAEWLTAVKARRGR